LRQTPAITAAGVTVAWVGRSPGTVVDSSFRHPQPKFRARPGNPEICRQDANFGTHRPGWALVGDAGYHKDPLTAEGITDAFRDAELLAEALDSGFAGRVPLDEALAAYERARNEDARPINEFTYELAGLEPPSPKMEQLFAALREDPVQTSRFFGVIARTVSFAEFFAPENVASIMSASMAA
jgi:hypothetical protein